MTTSYATRLGDAPEEGIKAPCVAATTANITLTAEQTVDGIAVVAGNRVLVKDQTDTTQNGIYSVAVGAWTRTKDFNNANDVINGVVVVDANSGEVYQAVFSGSWTPDTTTITFISQAFSTKLSKAGDTATGQISGITPTAAANFTRKDYVDAADALKLNLSGGTSTGQIKGITPVADEDLTRKDYVDDADDLKLDLAGGTVTGQISGITPTSAAHLARKDYVDTMLPLAGGTATGQIKGITPVADEDLVRKDYSDTNRIGDRVQLVRSSTHQTLAFDSNTDVAWNGETLDEANSHDVSINNSRIVIGANYNRIKFNSICVIQFDSTASATCLVSLKKNGSAANTVYFASGYVVRTATYTDGVPINLVTEWIDCAENDYYEIEIYNGHGSVNAKLLVISSVFVAELMKV